MAKAILNGNEIFGNVHIGEGGDVANPNIADVYDPTQTYNTGDRRIYDDVLYVCNDDNVTGAWDSTKWDSATIDEIISALTAADIPYSAGVSVADKLDSLNDIDIHAVKGSYSGIKGVYGGYISGSKNYFDFFIPCNTNGLTTITNVSFTSISVLTANGRSDNPFSSYSVNVTPMGLFVDCRYSSTQAASISGVVTFEGMAFTAN